MSPAVADGDWYRLLTSAFLHYGMTHLLFNMWALYVVGPPLEVALGRLRFAALYVMSALGGSVLVYLLSSAGRRDRGRLRCGVRPLRRDVRGGQAAQPRRPLGHRAHRAQPGHHVRDPVNISWQGHIGGLVTGAAIAAAYAYAPRESRTLVQVGATVAVLVLFALLIWWRTADLLASVGVA